MRRKDSNCAPFLPADSAPPAALWLQSAARRSLPALVAAILFPCFSAATALAADNWWNPDWKCRYRLTVSGPSEAVAWVRFNIPPGCHPKGEDLRIIDERGGEVRREVLFFEPAVYGVVAFDLSSKSRSYWLYLGNPKPKTQAATWTAQAGLFLVTSQMGPGGAGNLDQMRQMIAQSPWAFGAGFRTKIFDGFNPYGEPDRFVSVYRGWLQIRKAGQYVLITVSDDASFLLIDGKLVCQWPGSHTAEAGRKGRFSGKINLSSGVRRIDYYHCDFADDQAAEAAWIPPGASQPTLISEGDFVPVAAALPGSLEIRGQPLAPDFSAVQEEWLHLGDNTYAMYTFSDISVCSGGRIVSQSWEFSDGGKTVGPKISKMFFRGGDFVVKLTIRDDQGREASVERPFRVHAIDRAGERDEGFVAQAFANFAEAMNLDQLSGPDAASAGRLLVDQKRAVKAGQLYETLLLREPGPSGGPDLTLVRGYLDLMAESLEQPERAVEVGRRILARMDKNPAPGAQTLMRLARIELDQLRRPEEALTDFKAADLRLKEAKGADSSVRRDLLIGMGDAFRALGRREEAYAAYAEAEAIPAPNARNNPFDISSYALTVESWLLRREYDEARAILDQWEREHPTERLVGYSSILRARLEMGQGNYQKAVGELQTCLACKPVGAFAKQAMLLLAQVYQVGGEADKAREVYAKALEQFQDEDVQQVARRGMEQLGQAPQPRRGQ